MAEVLLGRRQQGCLDMLREFGRWNPTMPRWVWAHRGDTRQVLDSLVRRGLAEVDEDGVYVPTQ